MNPQSDDSQWRAALKAAMKKRSGQFSNVSSDPLTALINGADPETLKALLGAGTLDQGDTMLEKQLAQAHAMRSQLAGQQPYGLGGGIGNAIAQTLEGFNEHSLRQQQQANLDKRQKSIDAMIAALRGDGGG
jgi:hypothetical protein